MDWGFSEKWLLGMDPGPPDFVKGLRIAMISFRVLGGLLDGGLVMEGVPIPPQPPIQTSNEPPRVVWWLSSPPKDPAPEPESHARREKGPPRLGQASHQPRKDPRAHGSAWIAELRAQAASLGVLCTGCGCGDPAAILI